MTVDGQSLLPRSSGKFVGRAAELDELAEVLRGSQRLVTLVGAGGIGKTRLAVCAAERWRAAGEADAFGPVFVPLAAVTDAQLVESAILDAASLGRRLDPWPLRAVISHIDDREGLLVLDNCEHLVEAAGAVVESLLVGCPGLRLLVTSREPLGVTGEMVWQVPPLPTSLGKGDEAGPALSDAARLFLDRAVGPQAAEDLSDEMRTAVDRIVRKLDGIPLAMELAAARARTLSPTRICADLDRWALTTDDANRHERHRTMRRCLDWSHAMLTPAEATLFRRLSVFSGGWSLHAAEQVCGDASLPAAAVPEQLLALIDKSLVQVSHEGDEARYRMLWPVWQYAAEKLADLPTEQRSVVHRHRKWCVALAERADFEQWPLNRAKRARLDRELSNFRTGLENSSADGALDALRLTSALCLHWRITGRYAEGAQALAQALAAAPPKPHWATARALAGHAWMLYWQGDSQRAVRDAEAADAMARRVGDGRAQAQALSLLGAAAMLMDPPRAQPVLRRAAALAKEAGDPCSLGDASSSLSTSFFWQDDYPAAVECADAAEAVATEVGLHNVLFWNRWMHAHRAWVAGDLPSARRSIAEGQRLLCEFDPMLSHSACEVQALIDVMAGDAAPARASLLAEMERSRHVAVRWGTGFMTVALALAELALGDLASARAHAGRLYDREHGEAGYLAWRAQHVLMLAALSEGDTEAARRHAGLIREVAERLGNRRAKTVAQAGTAHAALLDGDLDVAEVCAHDALAAAGRNQWWLEGLTALELLAVVAARRGRHDRAVHLFAGVAAAREERGLVRVPTDDAWWSREMSAACDRVADPELRLAAGRAMPLPELADFAARGRGPRGRPGHGPRSLTPMQLNVAKLAAAGLSNADIALRLFIAPGTVKSHLATVFTKLDIHSRTQLAALDLPAPRPGGNASE
ncbi:MAG TPA: LuxR C-terminal-related transcriptional regulator [Yinghuangia sp.]|nr:LuxR C-terminal-related transcriptional regulator [Yinghuangia sp.]